MSYGIRFMAMAGAVSVPAMDPPEGAWLEAYDPEAFGGRGAAHWNMDPKRAMQFEDHAKAFALWRTVPRSKPRRPDGKPNRPLTAFTVSIEVLP